MEEAEEVAVAEEVVDVAAEAGCDVRVRGRP